jgi:hypothetical protein
MIESASLGKDCPQSSTLEALQSNGKIVQIKKGPTRVRRSLEGGDFLCIGRETKKDMDCSTFFKKKPFWGKKSTVTEFPLAVALAVG